MEGEFDVLIDTHCHIDRFPDASGLARKCESTGITTVAVTNIPSHYELGLPHLAGMQHVKLALGFHPLAVGENRHELPLFLRLLRSADFIGEIGIDLSKEGLPTKAVQTEVFNSIIDALVGSTKFVTMHSREAADEVLDVMERFDFHHGVFHWFSGSLGSLERAIEWGCWFSVNPSMIGSEKGKLIVARIPKERVLTETDGPYVKVGRRPAEPPDVKGVVSHLAELWKVSVSEAESQIVRNFRQACGVEL